MDVVDFPKGAERYFVEHNRQETVKVLKLMYQQGYRWIARDFLGDIYVFSLKPKKYRKLEIWGYPNPDLPGVLMAESVKNTDITELRWENKSPTDLEQFIKDNS